MATTYIAQRYVDYGLLVSFLAANFAAGTYTVTVRS
jgi:hypothetical protein